MPKHLAMDAKAPFGHRQWMALLSPIPDSAPPPPPLHSISRIPASWRHHSLPHRLLKPNFPVPFSQFLSSHFRVTMMMNLNAASSSNFCSASTSRQTVMSALMVLLLSLTLCRALPLSSNVELMEQPVLMAAVRPWADAGQPADWRGTWIRRLSPRVGHLSQMGLGSPVEVQKKWTRLEPSIRFV